MKMDSAHFLSAAWKRPPHVEYWETALFCGVQVKFFICSDVFRHYILILTEIPRCPGLQVQSTTEETTTLTLLLGLIMVTLLLSVKHCDLQRTGPGSDAQTVCVDEILSCILLGLTTTLLRLGLEVSIISFGIRFQ